MSTCYVECWKCDECGHRWIKGELWPDRCASSKCRKRSWNHKGGVAQPDREPAKGLEAGGSIPSPPIVPPVKMNDAMARFMATVPMPEPAILAATPEPITPANQCANRDQKADGDWYRCVKAKGHKGPHQPSNTPEEY